MNCFTGAAANRAMLLSASANWLAGQASPRFCTSRTGTRICSTGTRPNPPSHTLEVRDHADDMRWAPGLQLRCSLPKSCPAAGAELPRSAPAPSASGRRRSRRCPRYGPTRCEKAPRSRQGGRRVCPAPRRSCRPRRSLWSRMRGRNGRTLFMRYRVAVTLGEEDDAHRGAWWWPHRRGSAARSPGWPDRTTRLLGAGGGMRGQ